MTTRLVVVMVLVAFINMVDTLAYGARIAGVRTKSPSLAMSLYNMIALTSRTANLIQLPLIASIVDRVLISNTGESLIDIFRWIIMANSFGVVLGILLIPLAIRFFSWGILRIESTLSVPILMIQIFKPKNIKKAAAVPLAGVRHFKSLKLSNLPFSFLITNPVLVAFYSVGVLASIYAGYLLPEYRLTASQLSGIINGIATILLVIIVDPISALLLDETLKGKRDESELRSAIGFLALGRFVGTLIAQLLLIPAAYIIVYITRLIV